MITRNKTTFPLTALETQALALRNEIDRTWSLMATTFPALARSARAARRRARLA